MTDQGGVQEGGKGREMRGKVKEKEKGHFLSKLHVILPGP